MMKTFRSVFMCLSVTAIFIPPIVISRDSTTQTYQPPVNAPPIVTLAPQMGPTMTQSVNQIGQLMGQLSVGPMASPMMGQQIGQVQPSTYLNAPMNVKPMQPFMASAGFDIGTEVELSIRVANLPEPEIMDFDAVCTTSIRASSGNGLVEVHRTEAAHNELHPRYNGKPTLSYSFGERQTVVFKIINVSSAAKMAAKAPKAATENTGAAVGGAKVPKAPTQEKEEIMGMAECVLADLIARNIVTIPLQKEDATTGQMRNTKGEITIRAEKVIGNNNEVKLELSGTQLYRRGMMNSPSDLCLEIHKQGADKLDLVYKSGVIMGQVSASWNLTVTVRNLCNGDYRRVLTFVCWDWNMQGGDRELIGEFQTTLEQLSQSTGRTFTLTKPPNLMAQVPNPMAQMPSSYAQITVQKVEIIHVHTLAEFLQGGLQIHCSIAIDFTNTNGDPRFEHSFHYRDPGGIKLNQYEEAINAVLSTIESYDYDKRLQAYGFGGRYPNGPNLYDFNLNPNGVDCAGTLGVLQSYRNCLMAIELSEPCYFAPTIRKVVEAAEKTKNNDRDNYYILLILTHGDIADIELTEKVVEYAASLPISIIIVGIGDEKTVFTQMDRLDADHLSKVKVSTDPTAAPTAEKTAAKRRDIVQFIPFHKFREAARTANPNQPNTDSFLAKQVLAEVPLQLISYMRSKGYTPKERNFNNGLVLGQYYGSVPQPFGVPTPAFATNFPFPLLGGVPNQAQYNAIGVVPNPAQYNPNGMPQAQYNTSGMLQTLVPQPQYPQSGVSSQPQYFPQSGESFSRPLGPPSLAQPCNYPSTPAYGSYGVGQPHVYPPPPNAGGGFSTYAPPPNSGGGFSTYPPPPSANIQSSPYNTTPQQFQGTNLAYSTPPLGSANAGPSFYTPNPQYPSQNMSLNPQYPPQNMSLNPQYPAQNMSLNPQYPPQNVFNNTSHYRQ